jgi:3-methyladenine DNA glycosylase AlkD
VTAGPELTGQRLSELAAALWDEPIFECRLAAVVLLTDRRRLLDSADAKLVERLLRTSGTWALVDGLAVDVMGSLVGRFPELLGTLDRWAADADFWLRRSALLALLTPLRRGDIGNWTSGYADTMLEEREFFVRKAIGWVLRETGKKQPDLVADWLAPRVRRASGVTVREAVKWLPPQRRDALLTDHRAARQRPSREVTSPSRTAGSAVEQTLHDGSCLPG